MMSLVPASLRPGRVIPFQFQKIALEQALALVFREQLRAGLLEFLNGRWLAIAIEDAGIEWLVSCNSRGFEVRRGGKADTTFRGNLQEFVLLASRRQDPDTLFFQRRLSVTGDTALGLSCKNLMDAVEWDRWPRLANLALQAAADMVEWRSGQRPASMR